MPCACRKKLLASQTPSPAPAPASSSTPELEPELEPEPAPAQRSLRHSGMSQVPTLLVSELSTLSSQESLVPIPDTPAPTSTPTPAPTPTPTPAPAPTPTSIWSPSLWNVLHTAAEFSDRLAARNLWPILLIVLASKFTDADSTIHAWFRSHPYRKQPTVGAVHTYTRAWICNLHTVVNQAYSIPEQWSVAQSSATYGGDRGSRVAMALALKLELGADFVSRVTGILHAVAQ